MILLTSFSLTSPVMQIFFHHPLAALYNVVVLLFNLIVFLLTANHWSRNQEETLRLSNGFYRAA